MDAAAAGTEVEVGLEKASDRVLGGRKGGTLITALDTGLRPSAHTQKHTHHF